jgi:hypothetical protein
MNAEGGLVAVSCTPTASAETTRVNARIPNREPRVALVEAERIQPVVGRARRCRRGPLPAGLSVEGAEQRAGGARPHRERSLDHRSGFRFRRPPGVWFAVRTVTGSVPSEVLHWRLIDPREEMSKARSAAGRKFRRRQGRGLGHVRDGRAQIVGPRARGRDLQQEEAARRRLWIRRRR